MASEQICSVACILVHDVLQLLPGLGQNQYGSLAVLCKVTCIDDLEVARLRYFVKVTCIDDMKVGSR